MKKAQKRAKSIEFDSTRKKVIGLSVAFHGDCNCQGLVIQRTDDTLADPKIKLIL